MYAPRHSDFIAHFQTSRKARVPAPRNARDIIGFVVGAVNRDKHVAYFALERSRAIYGGLANVARKFDDVGISFFVVVRNLPCEHRQHKSAFSVFVLVVTSELPVDGQRVADADFVVDHQPFRKSNRYDVFLLGHSFYRKHYFIKPFAHHLVSEYGIRDYFSRKENFVVDLYV